MKRRHFLRCLRNSQPVRLGKRWFGLSAIALTTLGFLGAQAGATNIDLDPTGGKKEDGGDYNFKYGNLRLGLTGAMSAGYDDNITQGDTYNDSNSDYNNNNRRVRGWFIEPALTLGINWPVSPYLSISSSIGAGYRYYVDHEDLSDWFLTGDGAGVSTQIKADFKLGQTGVLTVYDKISRDIDSLQMDARSGKNNNNNNDDNGDRYAELKNEAGVQYANDLSEVMHNTVKYAHTNVWVTPSSEDYQSYESDMLDEVFLHDINKNLQLGPYATVTNTRFQKEEQTLNAKHNDSWMYEGGLAGVYMRDSGFSLNGRLGYQFVKFNDQNPVANANGGDTTTSPSMSLSANFASSELTSHTFFASYGISQQNLSVDTNSSLQMQAGYAIAVRVMDKLTLGGDISWINYQDDNSYGENANLYRYGIGPSYVLSPKSTLSLRYEYTDKVSNDEYNSYDRSFVKLTITYKF